MTLEEIKNNLYAEKIKPIIGSDFEYLYRHTCEFIVEQYKSFSRIIFDEKILSYILPMAAWPDFLFSEPIKSQAQIIEKIADACEGKTTKIFDLKLIDYPRDEEDRLMALVFFRHSGLDWQTISEKIKFLTIEQKEQYFDLFFLQSPPMPELNFFNYTFEAFFDLPTWHELKTQLRQSILVQDYSLNNGYHTPQEIIDAGLQSDYILLMKKAVKAVTEIARVFPQFSKYLIPLAFLQKVLFTININQLLTIKLDLAQKLWSAIKHVHPTIYLCLKNKNYETSKTDPRSYSSTN